MGRRRSAVLAAVCLIALLVSACSSATSGHGSARTSSEPVASSGAPASSPSGSPLVSGSSSGSNSCCLAAPLRHTLYFVGASYSAGLGNVTDPGRGYGQYIALGLGWGDTPNTISGTGYINGGPTNTFEARITSQTVDPQPGLTIIQGGRNDASYPPAQLQAAVCSTIKTVDAKYPDTVLVLLGPIPATIPVDSGQLSVEKTMIAASKQCDALFVDPIAENWINASNAKNYAGVVAGHPNQAGYEYIAARVVTDLRKTMLLPVGGG